MIGRMGGQKRGKDQERGEMAPHGSRSRVHTTEDTKDNGGVRLPPAAQHLRFQHGAIVECDSSTA